MQQAKRVAKNTGILYGKMLITVFISLYTTRLVLNALGTSDFGLFNLVAGAITMLGFLNSSMAAATQRFISYAEGAGDLERVKKIFNVSVLLHICIAIIVLLLLEIAGYYFFAGYLNISPDRLFAAKVIYQCMVASTLFTVISVPYDAVINAHENMLFFAILGIAEAVLKLLIALYILLFANDKLVMYGILMAVTSITLLLISRSFCKRKYQECSIDFKNYYDKSLMKEMATFASWSLLGASSSMIALNGQGIVLNLFFGTIANAALGIANQISGQLGAFATNMLRALNPIIAKSEGAGDRITMIRFSMTGSKISFFLLMIFYIPVLLEMPYILSVWLKIIPPYTIIFCILILVRNLIEQFYMTLTASIRAVGKILVYEVFTSILLIAPFLVSYLLFSWHYPPYFMYVSVIFFTAILCGVVIYFANLYCSLSIRQYLVNVVLRCIVSFLIVLLLAYIPHYFTAAPLPRLILVCAVTGIAYCFIVWHLGLDKNEKALFKKLLQPLKSFIRVTKQ